MFCKGDRKYKTPLSIYIVKAFVNYFSRNIYDASEESRDKARLFSENNSHIIVASVTLNEVDRTIKILKNKMTTGPDLIPI